MLLLWLYWKSLSVSFSSSGELGTGIPPRPRNRIRKCLKEITYTAGTSLPGEFSLPAIFVWPILLACVTLQTWKKKCVFFSYYLCVRGMNNPCDFLPFTQKQNPCIIICKYGTGLSLMCEFELLISDWNSKLGIRKALTTVWKHHTESWSRNKQQNTFVYRVNLLQVQ